MRSLTLKLKTIPTIDPGILAKIEASIRPPGNISKQDTIDAWNRDKRPAAVAEAIAATALDPAYGRICCIAWADELGPMSLSAVDPYTVREHGDSLRDPDALRDFDEVALLRSFDINVMSYARSETPERIVGHNLIDFDLRFLLVRSVILGVVLPDWLPINPRPWDSNVFDVMTTWAGLRDKVSLDKLCGVLDIPGGGLCGANTGAIWSAGEFESVERDCREDVVRIRDVFRRIRGVGALPERKAS